MTSTTVAMSGEPDSRAAGQALGAEILARFDGAAPDAVVVFASARHEYEPLLEALQQACRPGALVGSSSAGEFTGAGGGEGRTCALALRSSDMLFQAALGQRLSEDVDGAAAQVVSQLRGARETSYPFRAALVMSDALAGFAETVVERLTRSTGGTYQFFGGGAGDDARFAKTHVFCGTTAHRDAVVALEFLSHRPLGIGVGHGWIPAGPPLRVTGADRLEIQSLNGLPAVDLFEEHAARTGQAFDQRAPVPFFLHNILGIDEGEGSYRLRVPLAIRSDGAIACAAEVPQGCTVRIMRSSAETVIEAAARAARAATRNLRGSRPAGALFFDCVATRLRLGHSFGAEVSTVLEALDGVPLIGCNTYGQIARAEGQFGGFHNCTAVVCAFPE